MKRLDFFQQFKRPPVAPIPARPGGAGYRGSATARDPGVRTPGLVVLGLLALLGVAPAGRLHADDPKPVSFHQDVVPLLKRSCTGCHHPAKKKGELDLTTYAEFLKGGKHGASFVPGKPEESQVVEEIEGDEPAQLRLRWEEAGGPPVAAPARKGFGSRLIERALAAEVGGTAAIDYAREGVVFSLEAPLPERMPSVGNPLAP